MPRDILAGRYDYCYCPYDHCLYNYCPVVPDAVPVLPAASLLPAPSAAAAITYQYSAFVPGSGYALRLSAKAQVEGSDDIMRDRRQ